MMNYPKDELLMLLQLLATDHNERPKQRTVLMDPRLPTHHTYRERFGTLEEALKQAGVADFPSVNTIHEVWREVVEARFTDVAEWPQIGSMFVDYEGFWNGERYLIDIIDSRYLTGDHKTRILELREFIAKESEPDATYVQINGLLDIEKLPY